MNARKLLFGFQRYFWILAVFLFAMLDNLRWREEYGNDLFSYYVYIFGGVAIKDGVELLNLLASIVPCVIVLYLFSHVMVDDFKINCIYVFTRLGSKRTWLNCKTRELLLKLLLAYLLLFFIAFLLGVGSGLRFSSPSLSLIGAYLALLFCNIGTLFVLSYFQNILALRCGGTRSFLYCMIVYTGSLVMAFALYGKGTVATFLMPFLPASNQMYLWHDESALFTVGALSQNRLQGFRMIDSVAVLIIYATAIYLMAAHWLKKYDTVELMKEA